MRRPRLTAFVVSLVAFLMATLISQSRSVAQTTQPPTFTSQFEGGGFTRDPVKIGRNDSVTFAQDITFESADFENGFLPVDEEFNQIGGTVEAAPTSISPINPRLPGGVDHTAAGTGTRNAGSGTIRLRGVPPGATVVRAWLYWGTVFANPVPSSSTVTFNGATVLGKRVGNPTAEPCWLFQNASFAAYRSNVKPLISAGVNGNYAVSGLASAITNGSDPFTCAPPFPTPPTPGSEGATLVIIFSHISVPRTARTYIHQGPTLVTGSTTVTNSLNPLLPTHTMIKQTRFGADGQVGCGVFSVAALNGEITSLGPNPFALTIIKGPGSAVNASSDWSGVDGACMNQLWDTTSDAFSAVNGMVNLIPAGSPQYVVRYTGVGDCFVTVAHILTAK
jgi:hypothetical protein